MRIAAIAGLLLALLGSGAWGQGAWVTVAPEGGNFLAQMPENPQQTADTSQSPVGPIVEHIFSDTEGTATYTVAYSDLPGIAVLFGGAGTIYDNARGALLHEALGKQVSYSDLEVAGHPGKDLIYQTAGASPGYGRAWLVLVRTRLYVVNATDTADQPDLEKFLRSFQVKGN